MPITAKFSRQFYAKLGHDIADELVDWFNNVDATYRSEFRELFAVHFAQFDAKLEQRLAELKSELKSELHVEISKLLKWNFVFWVGTLGTVVALLKLS
ncbi:MAG: hypothetical protein ACE5HT_11435 [Gemmatimonadales bacterium]